MRAWRATYVAGQQTACATISAARKASTAGRTCVSRRTACLVDSGCVSCLANSAQTSKEVCVEEQDYSQFRTGRYIKPKGQGACTASVLMWRLQRRVCFLTYAGAESLQRKLIGHVTPLHCATVTEHHMHRHSTTGCCSKHLSGTSVPRLASVKRLLGYPVNCQHACCMCHAVYDLPR
jgi:hypothetical protein